MVFLIFLTLSGVTLICMPMSHNQIAEISERYRMVFLKYCLVIRKHGDYASKIEKRLIYQEVAETLGYRNAESVANIIRAMLKKGYSVSGDIDAPTYEKNLEEIQALRDGREI